MGSKQHVLNLILKCPLASEHLRFLTGWCPPPLEPDCCIMLYHLLGGLEHFLFSHILGIIIPFDFHIFQRGWNHQPVMLYPPIRTRSFWVLWPPVLGAMAARKTTWRTVGWPWSADHPCPDGQRCWRKHQIPWFFCSNWDGQSTWGKIGCPKISEEHLVWSSQKEHMVKHGGTKNSCRFLSRSEHQDTSHPAVTFPGAFPLSAGPSGRKFPSGCSPEATRPWRRCWWNLWDLIVWNLQDHPTEQTVTSIHQSVFVGPTAGFMFTKLDAEHEPSAGLKAGLKAGTIKNDHTKFSWDKRK